MLPSILKSLSKLAVLGALFCFSAFMVIKAPQFHGDYIRDEVGQHVVRIVRDESAESGGTGFLVVAPSGKNYILTNKHVCELADKNDMLNVWFPKMKRFHRVRVLERDQTADLCLVEAPKHAEGGVKVANHVKPGQELGIVGHPKLMPLTLSRGQLIGYGEIQMVAHRGKCDKEDADHKTMYNFFGDEFCVEKLKVGFTNIQALPGNSGSPCVDFFGELVGVLFAGNPSDNWGIIVSLKDIKEFLEIY